MPPWSVKLCNLYWTRRNQRAFDQAGRRRIYRMIAQEKRRLVEEVGVDREEVRLLCRHLANTADRHAENRWKAYAAQMRLAF